MRVVKGASRQQRKKVRAGIVLGDLPPSTVKRYNVAVMMFFTWFNFQAVPVTCVYDLDEAICKFIQNLWEEGDTIGIAGDTISGMMYHVRFLRKRLNASWKLVTAWRAKELPCRAPPLPLSVMLALAGVFAQLNDLGLTCAVLLGYHCFLRSMELFRLPARCVIIKGDNGVVYLENTKKGKADFVTILDPFIARLCLLRLKQIGPDDLFCGHAPGVIRSMFHAALCALGLQHFGFKWYSFRRGGATRFFQTSGSMDRTLERGRWDHSRTAKIYLADGIMAMNDLEFTRALQADMALTALSLRHL